MIKIYEQEAIAYKNLPVQNPLMVLFRVKLKFDVNSIFVGSANHVKKPFVNVSN